MAYIDSDTDVESNDSYDSFDSIDNDIIYTSICNECNLTHPSPSVYQCVTCGFKMCMFCFNEKNNPPSDYLKLEPWEEFYVFTCSKACHEYKLQR